MEQENKPKENKEQTPEQKVEGRKSPQGRPLEFKPEIGEKICRRVANGESLLKVCKDKTMPHRATVHRWLTKAEKSKELQEFSDNYEIAVNLRTDKMFEDMIDIADDGTNDYMEVVKKNGGSYLTLNKEAVMRSRLRVDTRKWFLSKVMPKKYGDKLDLTSDGEKLPKGNTITFVNFAKQDEPAS